MLVLGTAIYWVHRALHVPVLYASLHRVHHSFRVTTAWASFAFHPLDAFAQALPYHLCALLVPAAVSVYYGFLVFVAAWTVAIHDRVSDAWARWQRRTSARTMLTGRCREPSVPCVAGLRRTTYARCPGTSAGQGGCHEFDSK